MTLAERDTEKSNDLSTDLHSQAPVDADTLAMRRLKLWIRMLGVTRQAVHKKYSKRIDPSIEVPRRRRG